MTNGQPDPSSVEFWETILTRTVTFGDGSAIVFQVGDLLALLGSEDGAPNPLLAIVERHTKGEEMPSEQALKSDPALLHQLHVTLDTLLVKVVVAPPLKEQGHEHGIALMRITLDKKMRVFEELMGGAAFDAAQGFRQEPPSPVVAA